MIVTRLWGSTGKHHTLIIGYKQGVGRSGCSPSLVADGLPTISIAVDEATNELHAVELMTNAISDADMVKPLVAAISYPIARLSGDGAYDQMKIYDALTCANNTSPVSTR